MKLLAIDTAFESCSVAVVGGAEDQLIAYGEVLGRGHAERLFGMIATAMDEARLTYAQLDRIAVTVGPGSFTGLRVGIAAARGLALVVGCPVIGIGTLEAHAAAARERVGAIPVLAVLDARRDEIFGQRFAADGLPVGPPEVGTAEFFASTIQDGEVLAGSGADMVAALLPPARTASISHRQSSPGIRALVMLAGQAATPSVAPRPLYLRSPDAKPQAKAGVARR